MPGEPDETLDRERLLAELSGEKACKDLGDRQADWRRSVDGASTGPLVNQELGIEKYLGPTVNPLRCQRRQKDRVPDLGDRDLRVERVSIAL